jgi:hypothetical protein
MAVACEASAKLMRRKQSATTIIQQALSKYKEEKTEASNKQ